MSINDHFRNKLLAGVFAAIPVAVTAFVIYYAEIQTRLLFHVTIPFVGVLLAVAAIYLLGVIVTSVAGAWFLGLADRMLSKVPGLRELYSAWKQVTVTPGGTQGMFSRVVLISPENPQFQVLGFTSGRPIPGDQATACVFVPAAPNPTSGRLYLVPIASCRLLDVSPEEAFKMILSGGNYIPDGIGNSLSMRG